MQGSPTRRDFRKRARVFAYMVAGSLFGGAATGALLHLARGPIGDTSRPQLAAALTAVLALGDLWAIRHRRLYPVGFRRQTQQTMMFGRDLRRVAFTWGFDAGLGVTTYRVTSGIWVLILFVLLGVAPATMTLVYVSGFCVGLVVVALWPVHPQRQETKDEAAIARIEALRPRRRAAQIAYLLLLSAAGASLVL